MILNTIAQEISGRYRAKITFAGGEPTLLPFLPSLIECAKELGFITGIITNGSLLAREFLGHLRGIADWIGLSVDSVDPLVNAAIGRRVDGMPMNATRYLDAANAVNAEGFRLKINTVACRLNLHEDLSPFIRQAAPERWKVMQFLLVRGQNESASVLTIDRAEFRAFIIRQECQRRPISETAGSMLGSYVMIDPFGRPYGNAGGAVRYGEPVLASGLLGQLPGLGYDRSFTEDRGGFYY